MTKIFISYRRTDDPFATYTIHEHLVAHFGNDTVFIDIENLLYGTDFVDELRRRVGQCDILVAMIGRQWLETRFVDGAYVGQRRLDDGDDLVRVEIASALARNIPVIPVLLGGADMPTESELPEDLQALARRNAAKVAPGRDFHNHVQRLIRGIERLLSLPKGTQGEEDRISPATVTMRPLEKVQTIFPTVQQKSQMGTLPQLPAEQMDELCGLPLGKYLLGPVISKGTLGLIFHAFDTENNRPAALKVMWPEFARDDESIQRFIRAMKTMMPLRHPHVVSIYGAGRKSGYCWIAMEYVEGKSLEQLLVQANTPSALDWRLALRSGLQIVRALEFAHRHGIVHRDIKPSNVLIRSSDQFAKVCDVLLSKAIERRQPMDLTMDLTGPGEILGDPHYMPPEGVRGGHRNLDERSDLYGLGATMYRVLVGQPPAQGKSKLETLVNICCLTPASPSTIQPDIPAGFEKIVMKCLAKNPDERYQDAGELLSEMNWIAKTC